MQKYIHFVNIFLAFYSLKLFTDTSELNSVDSIPESLRETKNTFLFFLTSLFASQTDCFSEPPMFSDVHIINTESLITIKF